MKLSKYFVRLVIVFCASIGTHEAYGEAQNWRVKAVENEWLSLSGVFAQGSLLRGKVAPGNQVIFKGKKLRVTPEGEFIVGFGRDAETSQELTLRNREGAELYRYEFSLVKRDYPTQSVNGVPQKTVTPSKDKLARIRAETALVKNARTRDSDLPFFLAHFEAPMNAVITGVYGSRRIYNGTPKRPHYGLDYAGPIGAPVYAPASGEVTLVHNDMYYSGGTLIVDHGYGLSSTFIHLSEIVVEEGERIEQGQMIAKVGQGGRSTGPHLDWRINWYQERIDPNLLLLRDP